MLCSVPCLPVCVQLIACLIVVCCMLDRRSDLCRITCKLCTPPSCRKVKVPNGKATTDGKLLPGSRLTIQCDNGYELKGSKTATW